MIKRKNEHRVDVGENMFGGSGAISFERIIESPEELYGKGRVFSVVTLEPGCELGYHTHSGDGEYYYIISGSADYNDNGSPCVLNAGDSAFCPDGEGHSVKNSGSVPLVFIALIIFKSNF